MLRSGVRGRFRARMSWRRLALLLLSAGAAGTTTFALLRPTPPTRARPAVSGPQGPESTPTIVQPLPVPGAKQMSMGDAVRAFGAAIVLPNTPDLSSSDVGAVWMYQLHGDETQTVVSVTFPSQGLIIYYNRPAPLDPLTYFQGSVKSNPGAKLISLGSTPASYNPGTPDYWAGLEVIVGGATIDVLGHTSEASLQTVAQSIVDRATTSG